MASLFQPLLFLNSDFAASKFEASVQLKIEDKQKNPLLIS